MAARAPLSFLTETSSDQSDEPLRPEHFPALWAHFERYAHALVVARLGGHSLNKACAYAAGRRATEHLLATPGAVRGDLLRDQDLIEDLMQELAVALLVALRGGRLAAAVPAVKEWLRTTVRRKVPRASRAAAVHYFARGASPREEDADESPAEALARGADSAALAEQHETIARLRAHVEQLPTREKLAFERWVDGAPHVDVAGELGVTEVNARVLLSRALGRLRKAMPEQLPAVRQAPRGPQPTAAAA
jgi:RNA polymerase sigma factor (sigma-70 family)